MILGLISKSAIAILIFCVSVAHSFAEAETYQIDPDHSQIMFTVEHLGISKVSGRFDSFEGEISYDPTDVKNSTVSATISASSLSTNQKKRDEHLKSCDFFCIDSFPQITFASRRVEPVDEKEFKVIGDLTIHGITREVVLDVTYLGSALGYGGGRVSAFSGKTSLNRKNYGLRWNDLTETGGILVGDEVDIALQIEAREKGKEPKNADR